MESNSSDQIPSFLKFDSITPSFQRNFPAITIAILGFIELISGFVVLGLEFIIFDITLGLWCGGIYALAGAVVLVLGLFERNVFSRFFLRRYSFFLVIGTDRERHQISAVLIIQLVGKTHPCSSCCFLLSLFILALMFTITELFLHSEFYRTRCLSKPNEPIRELTMHCQIVLIQMVAAGLVLVCTVIFSIIYFRVTLIVLKQAHGTYNMSNAFQLTTC